MNDQLELNDSLQYFDKLCQLWTDSTFIVCRTYLKAMNKWFIWNKGVFGIAFTK